MLKDVRELEPGITALVVTYNQADTIERAVRSVMEQRGVDDLRILVADDASTDGTTDILRRLAAEDARITLVVRERNYGLGPKGNGMGARRSIVTKYMSFLEGDDFWCDPDKLRLQREALEAHPECTFCAHRTEVRNADGEVTGTMGVAEGTPRAFGFEEAPGTHPSSRLCRHPLLIGADFYADFMSENEIFCWDFPRQCAFLDRGPVWLLDRTMSVYNYNGKGVFSSRSRACQNTGSKIAAYRTDLYTGFRHTEYLRRFYLPNEGWKRRDFGFSAFSHEFKLTLSKRRIGAK